MGAARLVKGSLPWWWHANGFC